MLYLLIKTIFVFNVKTSPCWYVGTHESSYAPSVVSTVSPLKFVILLEKGSKFIENYMVIGDLNYDILTSDKSQVLDDLCDIFDLTNIVKNPTCVMKGVVSTVSPLKFVAIDLKYGIFKRLI
jgi:hypothetical protein